MGTCPIARYGLDKVTELYTKFLAMLHVYTYTHITQYVATDEPPEVTNHPESLAEVGLGQVVSFTVQATGTHPLNYQWEWKSAGSKEWKPCNAEGSDGVKITIPSVQKSDEGQYRCVVNNIAGSQKSKPARLEVS